MTCTENSENRLPKLKNVIKDQLIRAELRCRSTSVRQSNIFQDDKTFEKIIGKEPWTLRNYCSSWTSILRTRSRTEYNPHHLLLKLTMTLNTRLPKSSTLNSTSAVDVNFSIWYDGWAMKGQTRKWIGWSLLN